MPIITLLKTDRKIEVEPKSNLMKSLLSAQVPVASSCNGDGVCGKCKIQIVQGNSDSLSPCSELELHLSEKFSLKKNERISCQTRVNADVVVDATYW